MRRTNVMLLFGGESPEHDISIISARNVYAAIDDTKFNVNLCYITKNGKWLLADSFEQLVDYSGLPQVVPILGNHGFLSISDKSLISVDAILPILHGNNGEDGCVQGLAKLLHVPIVGCDVSASAICFDKAMAKYILEFNGIKTVPFEIYNFGDPLPSFRELSERLGDELFVKPARCGSSIGVNKVCDDGELYNAIQEATSFDSKILIEQSVEAREIEVGVLGSGKEMRVSCIGEILPDESFYTFDSKYGENNQSKVIIPADIDELLSDEIKKIAKKAFDILGCKGLSRVDFFLKDDGEIYLNEINTMPGFTNISMYPKLWRNQGVSYGDLIEILIFDALNK